MPPSFIRLIITITGGAIFSVVVAATPGEEHLLRVAVGGSAREGARECDCGAKTPEGAFKQEACNNNNNNTTKNATASSLRRKAARNPAAFIAFVTCRNWD
jgi:hypothetical protein